MTYGAEVTRLGAISHGAEFCDSISHGSRRGDEVASPQRHRSWRRARFCVGFRVAWSSVSFWLRIRYRIVFFLFRSGLASRESFMTSYQTSFSLNEKHADAWSLKKV